MRHLPGQDQANWYCAIPAPFVEMHNGARWTTQGFSAPPGLCVIISASCRLPTRLSQLTMPRDPLQCSHTKIVATVGPACASREQLATLVSAGVDVFRLNMAHAEPDAQQKHVDTIRSLSEEFNEPIAILVDLSGPKIRLGDIPGGQIFCDLGQEFYLIEGREPQSPNELTSTYPPLVEELQVGDRMMLADGTVCMEVVA